jgi:Flp pilus assembly protein TadD
MDEKTLMQKIQEEKYKEAFTEIKEYLNDHPKDKQQLKLLAKLQNDYKKKGQKEILAKVTGKIESKQFDEAIDLINEYLEIIPDDKKYIQLKEKTAQDKTKYEVELGYAAAKEQFDQENYSEAIKILTPLLKKYKTDQRLLKLKDDSETERWTQQSTKWDKEAREFLQGEDFDNALKKVEMILKRDSSNKNALKLREKILDDQKRTGKKKLWDEINTQIRVQNYSIALDHIKELLEIDPNDVKAQNLQSSIIGKEMKFEKKKVMDLATSRVWPSRLTMHL